MKVTAYLPPLFFPVPGPVPDTGMTLVVISTTEKGGSSYSRIVATAAVDGEGGGDIHALSLPPP